MLQCCSYRRNLVWKWRCSGTRLMTRFREVNPRDKESSQLDGRTPRLSVSCEVSLSNSCKISWEITFVPHGEKWKSRASGFLWLGTPGFTPSSQQENKDLGPGTAYLSCVEDLHPWLVRLQWADTQENGFQTGLLLSVFKKLFFCLILYVWVFGLPLCVQYMNAQCPQSPEEPSDP